MNLYRPHLAALFAVALGAMAFHSLPVKARDRSFGYAGGKGKARGSCRMCPPKRVRDQMKKAGRAVKMTTGGWYDDDAKTIHARKSRNFF